MKGLLQLPLETVELYLRYDEGEGKLYWRIRAPSMFGRTTSQAACDKWNYANAGEEAGTIGRRGYIRITILGKAYLAHRLIWLLHYREWPKDLIDHEDRNTGNNHYSNLRNVSNAINLRNAKRYSSNSSGASGVVWNKRDKRWHARIFVDGGQIHLGSFVEQDEAVIVRKAAEKEHGFITQEGK